MSDLRFIKINDYTTVSGKTVSIELSYQCYGKKLGDAPIVLVNHALTGNSNVGGEDGWWKEIVGKGKCIDTDIYSILAFNIPGNGYDGKPENLIGNYKEFVAGDIAQIFALGLDELNVDSLYAAIGGSCGGGLVWELAALRPKFIKKIIPIAADWKSTDWVIANCSIQDRILNNSNEGLADARMHAMTLYRTPESFTNKFKRSLKKPGFYNVESWLEHHGDVINKRFQISAYKMMNQILRTIDITRSEESFKDIISGIESDIHIVSINSDLLFKAEENLETYNELNSLKENVSYDVINSIHGHDAFLIEYDQLRDILDPIFNQTNKIDKAS